MKIKAAARRAVIIFLALLFVMNLATDGYCFGPLKKLGRGICNLLTFPFEIPHRMIDANKRSGFYEAMTYGFWEGIINMGGRAASGFWEIATFPIPIPLEYKPIMDDPEFLWQKHE